MVSPSTDEDRVAEQTIAATSPFESQLLARVRWQDLDRHLLTRLAAAATGQDPVDLDEQRLLAEASLRGLVWRDATTTEHYATAAGIVLLAKDPSASLPQCRILADAYRGTEADGSPGDHEDIRLPLPLAVDRAAAFVERNTRHPMKWWVSTGFASTNTRLRPCAKLSSMLLLIASTRTPGEGSCLRCSRTG